MKLYTISDLDRGAGAFDHVMRSFQDFPSRHRDMPGAEAIGFVAAAMSSGLNEREVNHVINGYFDDPTGKLLGSVRDMYLGEDQRIHMWSRQKDKTYSLCPRLRCYSAPNWRVDRQSPLVPY
ncbi:hypothetical protein [Sphingomonas sp.]|uniref:hypothetical protein n=1 Tax=Sphingomonas sp. TaxID=28214 RepID=UPI003CC67A34